jgi:hypothetical protein
MSGFRAVSGLSIRETYSRTSRIVRRIAAGDTGFGSEVFSEAYGWARVGTPVVFSVCSEDNDWR